MHKFSIIIPVYNTSKYLRNCLDSILNQTYSNFEIIIINDGSTDNSREIILSYKDANIKYFEQPNLGLSITRNKGLKYVTGDYILFLDSDDYYEKDLLEKINNNIKNNEDIIRFQIRNVYEDKTKVDYQEESFSNLSGPKAFEKLISYKMLELATCYAFKTSFFLENKFEFTKSVYHEDFGLIPLVIMLASNVTSISFIGYNYLQRDSSIMNEHNYSKKKKQAIDTLNQGVVLIKKVSNLKIEDKYKKIFNSFIANSIIIKAKNLKGKDFRDYNKKINDYQIKEYLLTDGLKRKIKKIMIKINLKLYLKIFR